MRNEKLSQINTFKIVQIKDIVEECDTIHILMSKLLFFCDYLKAPVC